MYKVLFILCLSLFSMQGIQAQQRNAYALVSGNDTLVHIMLPEVFISNKARTNKKYVKQKERHARTVHNVKKALPYARMAAKKILEIETRLAAITSEKEKKRIIKQEYDDLIKTFKKPLMQLTVTQGKILVRLIYRETQRSSFHHIKEYKGGANAYFWQTLALLFGNNLKADYEPEGRDAEIERIVLDIEAGRL